MLLWISKLARVQIVLNIEATSKELCFRPVYHLANEVTGNKLVTSTLYYKHNNLSFG